MKRQASQSGDFFLSPLGASREEWVGGSLEAPSRRQHVGEEVGLSPLKAGSCSLFTAESWKRVEASLPVFPSLLLPTDRHFLHGAGEELQTHVGPKLLGYCIQQDAVLPGLRSQLMVSYSFGFVLSIFLCTKVKTQHKEKMPHHLPEEIHCSNF